MVNRAARVVRNDDCSKLSNGIITFPTRGYAESAIHEMDGKNILSCAIKCSWDSEELDKNGNYNSSKRPSTCSDDGNFQNKKKEKSWFNVLQQTLVLLANMSYEEIFAQAPLYNTSISIGNLPEEIISKFQHYVFNFSNFNILN